MADGIVQPFLGALQAAASVLLTIGFGVAASQYNLLSQEAAKNVSRFCVRMALPCLMIYNVGKELESDTIYRYAPLLLWSLIYNIASILIGILSTRVFDLPSWTAPAIAFNNTTSLPLLLVQALASTGVLSSLLIRGNDSLDDAVGRAKSYFLINSMVSNSLTFALGPNLMNGQEEDGDDEKEQKEDETDEEQPTEHTSLMPNHVQHHGGRLMQHTKRRAEQNWQDLPPWSKETLDFIWQFFNAPFIGAVIGCIIGLAPPLKKAFFADPQEGGIFKAWLTTSIQNVGELFASLQVIVVGCKLASSMRKSKRGEDGGTVPKKSLAVVVITRYLIWPAISIPLMWILAKKGWLTDDPILWFCLMMLAGGAPATKLTALADVNGSSEDEKMCIAKFLTISYAISPLFCFTVVAALKAAVAAKGDQ